MWLLNGGRSISTVMTYNIYIASVSCNGKNIDPIYTAIYFGILKSALIGFSPNRGGVLSATSIAVMPRDHTSALAS